MQSKKNRVYIAFILIASIIYLSWGVLTPRYFVPVGAHDGLLLRSFGTVVPVIGLILYWLFGDRARPRTLCELTFFNFLCNYSYILHINHYHQIYVIGSFIIQTGANSIIDRERPLILYNLLNLLLALFIFIDPAHEVNPYFYLTAVGTIAIVMCVVNILRIGAQRHMLALEERLALEENKRIIFEGLAHEINNPLTILQSFKERIQKIASKESHEDLEETLEFIIKDKSDSLGLAVDRIKNVISDLHKTACGNLIINKEEIDVAAVTKELISSYAYYDDNDEEEKKQFDLHIETPLTLYYDRSSLLRILHEVLRNARDFARTKVSVTIYSNRILIANDGPAIPKDLEAKIFEPFFTTKDIGRGKGLGLSLAKGLSIQHSSTITLEKNQDHNVCFEIRFSA